MSAPRIGVTAVVRQWGDLERTGVNAAYVRAVVSAGGAPLVISPLIDPALVPSLVDGLDGILLTGGEDVDPGRYGSDPSPALESVDPRRDALELALVAAARQRSIPLLGVCRGIQVINVALGGTLWQDLPSERPGPVRHVAEASRDTRVHEIRVAAGSRLAAALGVTRMVANSIHHQAIRELAPGLVASAWAADGLIEGVESETDEGWLLGVQWHPEELHAEPSSPDAELFRALIEAGRPRASRDHVAPSSRSARSGEK